MEKTIIFMERFHKQVTELFISLGIELVLDHVGNARSKRGRDFEYEVFKFKFQTPSYDVVEGIIYEDWVHICLSTKGVEQLKQKHPSMVAFRGVDTVSLTGKWNCHIYHETDECLPFFVQDLKYKLRFLLDLPLNEDLLDLPLNE